MGIMGLGPLQGKGGNMVRTSGGALDLTRQISCQPPLRMPMGWAVFHQAIRARGSPLDS